MRHDRHARGGRCHAGLRVLGTMLIPTCSIIGMWGGERRVYATIKFVLFTLGGLAAFTRWSDLYRLVGGKRRTDLLCHRRSSDVILISKDQLWLLVFSLAFAIKVPLFPLHTWLPDAHTEAPTGGSVIFAGVLLKWACMVFSGLFFLFFPKRRMSLRRS